jgi:hypothetical protein
MAFILTTTLSRRLLELGLLVGGLGALVLAWGALGLIQQRFDRNQGRVRTMVGALLIGLGFLLQLVGVLAQSQAKVTPTPTPSTSVSSPATTPSASARP